MRKHIKEFLLNVIEDRDYSSTWIYDLEECNGKRWALVASWMDYDNDGTWIPYAKIAYTPTNSIMHEYDVDWYIPIEADETDDSEMSISKDAIDEEVKWFAETWIRYKEKYV